LLAGQTDAPPQFDLFMIQSATWVVKHIFRAGLSATLAAGAIAAMLRKQSSAVMAETNAENPRLSPQRPLGTFHRLGDLGKWRPRFRVRLELAYVLFGPRSAMG
jgi:hypothetical protein